jgi:NAD(P)-dependent dehydrogenase (short-subunit alcohol dehydrogenase family)
MTGAAQFSSDPTEFAGERALVTGGTQGMGEAIVRRLAAGGAALATTARSPLPDGQAVDLVVQADISTREGVDTVVRGVLDRLGGLDILVNNVGGSSAPSGGVLALTDEEWQRTIDANLLAAVRLDRAFLSSRPTARGCRRKSGPGASASIRSRPASSKRRLRIA